jgi:hypothetical protein
MINNGNRVSLPVYPIYSIRNTRRLDSVHRLFSICTVQSFEFLPWFWLENGFNHVDSLFFGSHVAKWSIALGAEIVFGRRKCKWFSGIPFRRGNGEDVEDEDAKKDNETYHSGGFKIVERLGRQDQIEWKHSVVRLQQETGGRVSDVHCRNVSGKWCESSIGPGLAPAFHYSSQDT